MYFLIGLGVIVVIIYGNMFYDRIKAKKDKDTDNIGETQLETDTVDTDHAPVAEDASAASAHQHLSVTTLTEMIAADLKQQKNIFGLPLTLCEEEADGRLIAMDREDNIYVIETAQRPEYEEFYLQVLDDIEAQRKRIQKHAAERKVYAIVCVTTLPDTLKLAAERENAIRIFSYELNFRNIM